MAKFKQAIFWLRQGKKVRRPIWEKDSYWKLGIDEKICWKDMENARIHLNQIEAKDWGIFQEKKPKVVILDDNELSIMQYAEEYPENWKKICDALDKKKKQERLPTKRWRI